MSDLQRKLESPLIDPMFDLEPVRDVELGRRGWFDRRSRLTFQFGPSYREGPNCAWWHFATACPGDDEPLTMSRITLTRTVPGSRPVEHAVYEISEADIFEQIDAKPLKTYSDAIERRIGEFEEQYHDQIRSLIAGHRRSDAKIPMRQAVVAELGGREQFKAITLAAIRACHVRWQSSKSGGYSLSDWAETVDFVIKP